MEAIGSKWHISHTNILCNIILRSFFDFYIVLGYTNFSYDIDRRLLFNTCINNTSYYYIYMKVKLTCMISICVRRFSFKHSEIGHVSVACRCGSDEGGRTRKKVIFQSLSWPNSRKRENVAKRKLSIKKKKVNVQREMSFRWTRGDGVLAADGRALLYAECRRDRWNTRTSGSNWWCSLVQDSGARRPYGCARIRTRPLLLSDGALLSSSGGGVRPRTTAGICCTSNCTGPYKKTRFWEGFKLNNTINSEYP